jgi:hypothetical protein
MFTLYPAIRQQPQHSTPYYCDHGQAAQSHYGLITHASQHHAKFMSQPLIQRFFEFECTADSRHGSNTMTLHCKFCCQLQQPLLYGTKQQHSRFTLKPVGNACGTATHGTATHVGYILNHHKYIRQNMHCAGTMPTMPNHCVILTNLHAIDTLTYTV